MKKLNHQFMTWLYHVWARIGNGPFMVTSYTVDTAPDASLWGDGDTFSSLIYVSDESGSYVQADYVDIGYFTETGPILAFSDGTNWRRFTDRTIVS